MIYVLILEVFIEQKTLRILVTVGAVLLTLILITAIIFLTSKDSFALSGAQQPKPAISLPPFPKAEEAEPVNGTLTISICSNPCFEDGTSKGNLNIINEKQNKYGQIVRIYRDSDNLLIYETDIIPVGLTIPYDKLDVVLPAGDYECTAYFYAVDEFDQPVLSGNVSILAGAKIIVTIEN